MRGQPTSSARRQDSGPSKAEARKPTPAKAEAREMPALAPRPVLLAVLSIILALWLVALVVMRLTTVNRPLFHTPAATQPFQPPS